MTGRLTYLQKYGSNEKQKLKSEELFFALKPGDFLLKIRLKPTVMCVVSWGFFIV